MGSGTNILEVLQQVCDSLSLILGENILVQAVAGFV
jgi:hypothetical protein